MSPNLKISPSLNSIENHQPDYSYSTAFRFKRGNTMTLGENKNLIDGTQMGRNYHQMSEHGIIIEDENDDEQRSSN